MALMFAKCTTHLLSLAGSFLIFYLSPSRHTSLILDDMMMVMMKMVVTATM